MYLMLSPNPERLQVREDFPSCLVDSGSEVCCWKDNTGLSVLWLPRWLTLVCLSPSLPVLTGLEQPCGEPAGYRTDARGDAPGDQQKGWRDMTKGYHPAVGLRSAFDECMGGCNTVKPFSL